MSARWLALVFVLIPTAGAIAQPGEQPAAGLLPEITWSCFQSFGASTPLPEYSLAEVAVAGDNFGQSTARYRLQVIDKTVLKIISYPHEPVRRTEVGTHATKMTRDFSGKHQIAGWRERSDTGLTLYTIHFDHQLFSVLSVPFGGKLLGAVELNVYRCKQ